jgi:mannose-6-phosphate isomerase-like protein (cupin superfamily)
MKIKKEKRPWGYYETILSENGYKVKRLVVYPLKRLSLQKHRYRNEIWTTVLGRGIAEIRRKENNHWIEMKRGTVVDIKAGNYHRVKNTSKTKNLVFIEVQTGSVLLESDIVRLEDDFGRVP